MEGFWVGVTLILVYLATHVAIAGRGLSATNPLDVDEGLTYPALSQASSVFSLSALFGAYLGMYWLLGFPAIFGVALGGIGALAFVRHVIRQSGATTFDLFLRRVFDAEQCPSRLAAAGMVVLTQIAYVASELLILRQLLVSGFAIAPRHATTVVTCVAVIGYWYLVRGGYVALFRADTVQAVVVIVMLGSLVCTIDLASIRPVRDLFVLRDLGYWQFGLVRPVLSVAHVIVGGVMGFCFLLASPDAWKRVFLVTRRPSRRPFVFLVLASLAPFLMTLPLVLGAATPRPGPVTVLDAFPQVRTHDMVLMLTLLGMIASCLSAVNGSLLTAIHVALVNGPLPTTSTAPASAGGEASTPLLDAYHLAMAGGLLAATLLFVGLQRYGNAYALGIYLLGPFAATAGLLLGSGALRHPPDVRLLLVGLLAGLGSWTMYFVRDPGLLQASSTTQADMIPIGLSPFLILLIVGLTGRLRQTGRST